MKSFFVVLFLTVSVWAQTPQKIFSKLFFGSQYFSYITNFDLDQKNESITQVILVVHGSALNAETYFNTVQNLATQKNKENQILVIAPHYRTDTEVPLAPSNELLWTDEGWLSSDTALNDPTLDSFSVIDTLVSLAVDKKHFPNLKNIVITGHSAGGQLTQKYALGSKIESHAPRLNYRYVVLNPGSYTYINPKRLNSQGKYSVPENPGCDYDNYKYGLEHLNRYMRQIPQQKMVQDYINKNVIYLLGDQDTLTIDFDLSCPALLQGPYRYKRGLYFKAFLDSEFPQHRHSLVSVPGVGHTQAGMYTSVYGIQALFDGF